MKLKIATIILFVQDVNRLKIFYQENLQLKLVEEIAGQWVVLAAGNCNIGLHKVGQQYEVAAPETFRAESNTKIVFECDEDIFNLQEQLSRAPVKIEPVKTFENYGFWLCDGEDPEGNVFQLQQKKQ